MRNILFLLFLAINAVALATDYYVSSSTGNDDNNGRLPTTPWKTIEKVNSEFSNLKPGDRILFKRGDIFFGTLLISNSGTANSPITIGAYGEGDKPVITSFETLTSWTSEGVNIYSHALSVEAEQIKDLPDYRRIAITVDNNMKWMGRWPDTGYRTITADGTQTTLIDSALATDLNNELGLTPNDVIGAEIFGKLRSWFVTRGEIEGYNAGTNTLTIEKIHPRSYGWEKNHGYFLQGHMAFLSSNGDWYYDDGDSKLYMYLDNAPDNYTIKAATRNHLVDIGVNIHYVVVENLSLQGSNRDGAYRVIATNPATTYITLQDLDINFIGGHGINLSNSNNCLIDNNTVNNTGQTGIGIRGINNSVTNNKVYNLNVIPGMWDSPTGIRSESGANCLIQYNHIEGTGGHGIIFGYSSNVEVRNNTIIKAGLITDDIGAIYFSDATRTGQVIDGNIILNTQGNNEGTPYNFSQAVGIYADESINDATITNNISAYSTGYGMLLHKAYNINVDGNTFYANVGKQVFISGKSVEVEDIKFNNNILIGIDEDTHLLETFSLTADPDFFQEINNNLYLRHDNVKDIFRTEEPEPNGTVYYDLAGWQDYVDGDANSTAEVIDKDDLIFEYNVKLEDRLIIFDKPMIDAKGTKYINSITLSPYTAAVLMVDLNPPKLFNISININGNGFVKVNEIPEIRSINVEANKPASIEAIPLPGWKFSHWAGDASGSVNPLEIIMDDDKTITAIFRGESFTLTTTTEGEGNINLSPAQESYTKGTIISIEAIAEEGWKFEEWDGDLASTNNKVLLKIESDNNIIARFSENPTSPDGLPGKEEKVLIYPNPASNFFSISVENASFEPESFRIIDLSGRIVYGDLLFSKVTEIQIPNHLPAAIYIIELLIGGLPIYVQRLVFTK